MAVKIKTWVWVVVGIVVVGILLVIAMAGAGLYFFSQNIKHQHRIDLYRCHRIRYGPRAVHRSETAHRAR